MARSPLFVPALLLAAVVHTMPARAVSAQASSSSAPVVAAEVPVTAVDLGVAPARNSPAVAADPTDPRFVVVASRVDAPSYSCGLELSGDGGRSWVPAQPVPALPPGAERCYAPEVAFDRDGVLHYLFVGLHGLGNEPMGVFLTTSDDRGRSFGTPRRILGPNVFGVRMVIDRGLGDAGRLHLVWLQANSDPRLGSLPPPPNPIMAAFSDDGGRSFSAPVQVSDPERQLVVAPALVVGADHAVHVLTYDLGDDQRDYYGREGPVWEGTWSLILNSSYDAGGRFERGAVVEGAVVPTERVMLIFTMAPATVAADRSGRVYVAWGDARNGDWDVLARRSGDGGRSWPGAPVRVNDDPAGSGKHQFLPRLATAPGGRVDAVFYDRRNSPDNLRHDAYFASSSDGGGTFAPNQRLSSEPSDARVGARYPIVPSARGRVEIGARLGLLSTDARAVAAWGDTRIASTNEEALAGFDPTSPAGLSSQEIFAAVVEFSPAPDPIEPGSGGDAGAVVAVATAVVLGVVLVAVTWAVVRHRRRAS